MDNANVVPLIIDGHNVFRPSASRYATNIVRPGLTSSLLVQGADKEQCIAAVESCARAFPAWAATPPQQKRKLFLKLSQLLREKGDAIKTIIEDEINCSPLWSHINLEDSIGIVDELASLTTSGHLAGSMPLTTESSQALVFMEPLGVVLGIAPWNAPLTLGLRSVAVPVAAGNTAILKGSELSPRTHHFIANLFREAGFPAGVVNFITHKAEDASECFDTLINHTAIRKCNFTGSTAVGRIIASKAGAALKPVLLELGGKNFAIVLEDADVDQACAKILQGAFINNGQVCMSTDTVLVVESIAKNFQEKLAQMLPKLAEEVSHVITNKSRERLEGLLSDAVLKGGKAVQVAHSDGQRTTFPGTIVENITPNMRFCHLESFGPMLGVRVVRDETEALAVMGESFYGLSSAVFSKSHFRALQIARKIKAGAVHINGSTVHDAPNLPHGGYQDSGFGRFGAHWGLMEFVQTKTVIINE